MRKILFLSSIFCLLFALTSCSKNAVAISEQPSQIEENLTQETVTADVNGLRAVPTSTPVFMLQPPEINIMSESHEIEHEADGSKYEVVILWENVPWIIANPKYANDADKIKENENKAEVQNKRLEIYDSNKKLIQSFPIDSARQYRPVGYKDYNFDGYMDIVISDGADFYGFYNIFYIYVWNPTLNIFEKAEFNGFESLGNCYIRDGYLAIYIKESAPIESSAYKLLWDGSTLVNAGSISALDGLNYYNTGFDITTMNGSWVVGDIAFRNISAIMKQEQEDNPTWDEDLIGSIVKYDNGEVIYDDKVCEIKKMRQAVWKFDDLFKKVGNPSNVHVNYMRENGYESLKNYLIHMDVLGHSEGNEALKIGSSFYVIDENHILFLTADGYAINGYRIDEDEVGHINLPTPPAPPNPEYLYGSWIIEKDLHDEDDDFYVGRVFEYQKDFVLLDGVKYENPLYSYDVPVPADLYFNDWYSNLDFGAASAQNTNEFIYPHNIFSNRTRISYGGYTALGACPYYINENYIVLECLNDVFLASRVK